jgi:hypothetical protein
LSCVIVYAVPIRATCFEGATLMPSISAVAQILIMHNM